ncbi:MAG: hypothetical protein VYC34_08375, partial [Planctomycetota bacterium]|nr:hypothetical protein [Planctomycetota bacterium]
MRRKRKGPPRWSHPLLTMGARGAAGAVNLFDFEDALKVAAVFGDRFARLPANRRRRQRAIDNIRWCFPEWTEERIEECS